MLIGRNSPSWSTGTQPWKIRQSSRTRYIEPWRHEVVHVLPELLAGQERVAEAVHAAPFLGRQLVGIGRVDRRQVRVAQRIAARRRPRWSPSAWSIRCSSRRCSISHCGLRAIICPSSLNCMIAAAFCIRATIRSGRMPLALGHEAGRRIVGVDGPGQVLQRRERDAVALVELAEPPVAERDAQHVADQRLVAEAAPRARPRRGCPR